MPPKIRKQIFWGNYYVKFGHFSGKNHVKFGNFVNFSGKYYKKFGYFANFSGKDHVKFGHFVNFSYVFFGQKCRAPLKKLTELLRLWWHSIRLSGPVLAGELSLSCARPTANHVTTLWVRRPLSVNQHGQLSQPSLRGRLNEYSNPLMMDYRRSRPTASWRCLWPVIGSLRGACVCRLWAVT